MAGIADQHQNCKVLLNLTKTRLLSLRTQPIGAQIKELGPMNVWRQRYHESGVPNAKVDQLAALERLQEWLLKQRNLSEQSLRIDVQFDNFPPSKRQQYDQRLRDLGEPSQWDKCFVKIYTAAEWAFETWAKRAGLDCNDRNTTNPYDPQDYSIADRSIDVKTTISVGRSSPLELKCYWAPSNLPETGEIICAVRSTSENRDSLVSRHHIQGIFHPPIYENISVRLKHFKLSNPLLNACYFHSPKIFFGVKGPIAPQLPSIDPDVVDYCVENAKYLDAIFHPTTHDIGVPLSKILPPGHQDFVPIASELMNREMRHLIPHYLADYFLEKIIRKESIDMDAIRKAVWPIFTPSADQEKYLTILVQVQEILSSVRCAHHPNKEGIEDMDIKVVSGEKLILRACCPTDPQLGTTLLAYSWKTLEPLIYGRPGISVCDAPGCGCLTHVYHGEKIGRRTCNRYGDSSRS